ncbi:MAG: rhomboid family intramembrane serine protease [Chitinophagaceae bacterium]|nr:rhomboid family intramembrane serine protease [Chitinophagaceae bacterium]
MSNFRFTRPDSFPPIVKNLIILNVLAWLAQLSLDGQYQLTSKGALWPINTPFFEPYQVVTHMFLHAPSFKMFFHILFNMFALYMFGRVLENIWGPKRFLFFYLACGLGAAAAHLTMQYIMGTYSIAVGASGAVMGVMVAFGYLFPNTELMIMPIPIPVKAKWVVIGYILLDLFGGFGNIQGDNIAHFAHLGGAITGFIIVLIWNKTNRRTLY